METNRRFTNVVDADVDEETPNVGSHAEAEDDADVGHVTDSDRYDRGESSDQDYRDDEQLLSSDDDMDEDHFTETEGSDDDELAGSADDETSTDGGVDESSIDGDYIDDDESNDEDVDDEASAVPRQVRHVDDEGIGSTTAERSSSSELALERIVLERARARSSVRSDQTTPTGTKSNLVDGGPATEVRSLTPTPKSFAVVLPTISTSAQKESASDRSIFRRRALTNRRGALMAPTATKATRKRMIDEVEESQGSTTDSSEGDDRPQRRRSPNKVKKMADPKPKVALRAPSILDDDVSADEEGLADDMYEVGSTDVDDGIDPMDRVANPDEDGGIAMVNQAFRLPCERGPAVPSQRPPLAAVEAELEALGRDYMDTLYRIWAVKTSDDQIGARREARAAHVAAQMENLQVVPPLETELSNAIDDDYDDDNAPPAENSTPRTIRARPFPSRS